MFKIKRFNRLKLPNGKKIELTPADEDFLKHLSKFNYEEYLSDRINEVRMIQSGAEKIIRLIKNDKIPKNSSRLFKAIQKLKVNRNLLQSGHDLLKRYTKNRESNLLNVFKELIANVDIEIDRLKQLTDFS